MTKSQIPWDETHSEILKITESLGNLTVSRAASAAGAPSPLPDREPQFFGGFSLARIEDIRSQRTYLLKKAPPTALPPRQDVKRIKDGGNDMASVPILQDSLKYYEKARRTYENNVRAREKVLTISGRVTPRAPDDKGDGPEPQEDMFLDYIQQIIKHINRLLSRQNYDYDRSWGSMVDELDLDEGFFVTNIRKSHQYGELYEFLVATRCVLGEHRTMQTYFLCPSEEIKKFGEEKLGKYLDIRKKTNWCQTWYEIGRERDLLVEYIKEFEEYHDDIQEMRYMKANGYAVETFLPPEKPYTPYIDDIISASCDTGITNENLATEVILLAEEMMTGDNIIKYGLESNDLNYLRSRFKIDMNALRFIYQGHPDPEMYTRAKTRLEKFRRLLFICKDGAVGPLRPTWLIAGVKLLEIFRIEDGKERLKKMDEFLNNPNSLPGLEEEVYDYEYNEYYEGEQAEYFYGHGHT
ncbi:hypothetical protein TWF481_009045 [Arthrobotrys musiformis]|uniref:Uncharacterized protein n=1 Tax=Arthrobotrys musiformis TaxID=47236 RepID=A0AAV9W2K6_9PEZI